MEELKAEGKTIEGRMDEKAAKISLSAGKIDDLFRKLVTERFRSWMELADERLKDSGKVAVKDYEMITLSWSNPTPCDTAREYPEETLEAKIDEMASQVDNMETTIFNMHVPPYDTLIDQAPKLSDKLVPATDESIPAGSMAVLNAIKKYQPLLGLHGHIHESRGIQKINRTLCINPGSEYSEGILRGVIVTLKKSKIKDYMFVSG